MHLLGLSGARSRILSSLWVLILVTLCMACGESDPPPPAPKTGFGQLSLKIIPRNSASDSVNGISSNGLPAVWALLELARESNEDSKEWVSSWLFTDAKGTVVFSEVPVGRYRLTLLKNGYELYPNPLLPENLIKIEEFKSTEWLSSLEEGNLLSTETTTITGVVRKEDVDQPGAQVVLRTSSGIVSTSKSDKDGRFILVNVPLGTYELQARKKQWKAVFPTPISVQNLTPISGALLNLTEEATRSLTIAWAEDAKEKDRMRIIDPQTRAVLDERTLLTTGKNQGLLQSNQSEKFVDLPAIDVDVEFGLEPEDKKVADPQLNGTSSISGRKSFRVSTQTSSAALRLVPAISLFLTETTTVSNPKITWAALQNADFYAVEVYDEAGNRVASTRLDNGSPIDRLRTTNWEYIGLALRSKKRYVVRVIAAEELTGQNPDYRWISASEWAEGIFFVD